MFRAKETLLSLVALGAFLVVLVVCGLQIVHFRGEIEYWARRDLRSQAMQAATNLDEALRTQDFRRIQELAGELQAHHLFLDVRSPRGGTLVSMLPEEAVIEESVRMKEHLIGVAAAKTRVFQPFTHALGGFALAVLVGVLGMCVVFFVLYRQHVRIRELARLERFRREFVADVSHEIKTPLTGILGAVDLLSDASEPSPEVRTRLLEMLRTQATRLHGLVQQILDLSRLEREGETIVREQTDLVALVRELAARYVLALRLPAEPTLILACDARLIEQALVNLIENARRHSGSTEIILGLASRSDGRAELSVEDHGVGIAPEHRARIFERFYRVDPSRATESGGAGLGLAIVQRIARLHGGEVFYEAVSPHGSRFVLRLLR